MAPSLEQEVNLSRRACRKLTLISDSSSNNSNTILNTKISDNSNENYLLLNNSRKDIVYVHNKLVGAKLSPIQRHDDDNQLNKFHMNCRRDSGDRQIPSSGSSNKSQFNSKTSYLIKYLKNLGEMISCNRLIVILVLINVLLLNCGYVMARPNLSGPSNLVESSESGNVSIKSKQLISHNDNQSKIPLQSVSSVALEQQPNDAMPTKTVDPMEGESSPVPRAENTDGGHGDGHAVERFPVSQIDFVRVETPFIIGVWILFASIAKIGEFFCVIKRRKVFTRKLLVMLIKR